MRTDVIQTLAGTEARDPRHLPGREIWRTAVASKAGAACEVSGPTIQDHFVDVNKMVDLGSASRQEPTAPNAATLRPQRRRRDIFVVNGTQNHQAPAERHIPAQRAQIVASPGNQKNRL